MWRGKDSNLRRQSRQIYSLIPLTGLGEIRSCTRGRQWLESSGYRQIVKEFGGVDLKCGPLFQEVFPSIASRDMTSFEERIGGGASISRTLFGENWLSVSFGSAKNHSWWWPTSFAWFTSSRFCSLYETRHIDRMEVGIRFLPTVPMTSARDTVSLDLRFSVASELINLCRA